MSSAPLSASAIVIGDEILGGFVRDTNSGWLAERLQAIGVPLERVTTIPDDLSAIDESLAAELARKRPRVVVTSGGIGSTPDDLTMAGVARHLDVPLVVEPAIDARITDMIERSAARGVDISASHEESLRKMAEVPQGAYLLGGSNVAPGVAVDVDGGCRTGAGATIVILPGIPSVFQRIVTGSVEPDLLEGRGLAQHVVELTHPYPESVLNPVLHELVTRFPGVHVGSYPGWECTIRLKGDQETVQEAAALVDAAIESLHSAPGARQLREGWQSHWSRDDPQADR